MQIKSLLDQAFVTEDAARATQAIDRAHDILAKNANLGGFSYEVTLPDDPDERWVVEHLVRPLVYLCESKGNPVPACPGVFVAFYRQNRILCVLAAEVIAWAEREFELTVKELIEQFGTGEEETAQR